MGGELLKLLLIVSFLQSIFVSADSLKLILFLKATNSEWSHLQAHQSDLSLTKMGLIHLSLQLCTILRGGLCGRQWLCHPHESGSLERTPLI